MEALAEKMNGGQITTDIVRNIMRAVPSVNYDEHLNRVVEEDLSSQLPPDVRAMWRNPERRAYVSLGAVETATVSKTGASLSKPFPPTIRSGPAARDSAPELSPSGADTVEALLHAANNQVRARLELRARVHAAAQSSAAPRVWEASVLASLSPDAPPNVIDERFFAADRDDILQWADGGWCFAYEMPDMLRSDERAKRLPRNSAPWVALMESA